ncbi:MAG TPA: UpxY family transcription antiterminator [Candidatus Cloacimonas sp.]|jgi:transcriptional antiterminator RfaH|nr:UpxY family transcription antiterminator [Candidatus Cloacimonas sp.]MDD3733418.1 UpxY family transcription antiterminator [Candidatus Cloacimonadota bacterium]HPK59261.1 UpxY family transcription antiterminator [Candidatus Cloacimonas sp.]
MATHKPVYIDELYGELELFTDDRNWVVVHTKPRCEKKVADYAKKNQITYYLPQYTDKRVYQRRKVDVDKILFPSYIFVGIDFKNKQELLISGYTVNFLKVNAQKELVDELRAIYYGRQTKVEMQPGLWLEKGLEVEIVNGPLKGIHGVVENQSKLTEVRLQVNILRQAVLVKVSTEDIKIIGEYEVVEID